MTRDADTGAMSSLQVRDLYKNYGSVEVLKGINLEARAGEFVALVGPSGCGKSTLLAMIAGLETITTGEIWIGDRLVNSVAPKDRDIAMVFQSYALYPTMTVRQNMLFGMESRGVPKARQQEAIERVSNLLQIHPLLNRKPGQLSGGQRQRVAMGRALVRDPQLFLFDEPLSNLDAKLRVEMRTEIKKLHNRVGKTTIYVTHDQVEAMTLASRIAVMHQGQVQQFDEPQTVYDRPANMFVAGFMGSPSMNFISGQLVDAGGRTAVAIQGANGTETLPLFNGAAQHAAGRDVILGVRPEHLFRHTPELQAQKPGLASLTAPVELVEPTGAETMAVMRLGDKEIVGRFDPDGAPLMGENLKLGIDMSHACLFEPSSQRLI
jgi:multiple sugar transport system ATP-binding protein